MKGARDPHDRAEAAADWFVRLQSEEATLDDWRAFEAWLSASPDNQAAYEEVERAWIDLEDLTAVEGGSAESLRAEPRRRFGREPSRRGWLVAGSALAASLVAAVGVGLWGTSSDVQAYAAEPGHTRQVVLADGSHVWLNAGSRIQVRFSGGERRVEMADGEALFDVTHDVNRPFLITAGDRRVRVVGTQFDLRRRGGEFALTVSRGIVEVSPSAGAGRTTRVVAGQSLRRSPGSASFVLSTASVEQVLAWTQGRLVYENAPLSEVAADLSRSLGAPIKVADEPTGAIRFSGVLELDDRADVMRRIEAYANVEAQSGPTGVTLRRR